MLMNHPIVSTGHPAYRDTGYSDTQLIMSSNIIFKFVYLMVIVKITGYSDIPLIVTVLSL